MQTFHVYHPCSLYRYCAFVRCVVCYFINVCFSLKTFFPVVFCFYLSRCGIPKQDHPRAISAVTVRLGPLGGAAAARGPPPRRAAEHGAGLMRTRDGRKSSSLGRRQGPRFAWRCVGGGRRREPSWQFPYESSTKTGRKLLSCMYLIPSQGKYSATTQ